MALSASEKWGGLWSASDEIVGVPPVANRLGHERALVKRRTVSLDRSIAINGESHEHVAVIDFFFSLLFVIPIVLIWNFAPIPAASKPPIGPGILVLLPFLHAGAGLLFVALTCAIYNLAANFIGGLGISPIEVPDA